MYDATRHDRFRCEFPGCPGRPATHKVAEDNPMFGWSRVCSSHVAPEVHRASKFAARHELRISILPTSV